MKAKAKVISQADQGALLSTCREETMGIQEGEPGIGAQTCTLTAEKVLGNDEHGIVKEAGLVTGVTIP
jgi:hypothetical protein